jgi:FAD/FMN-containing dehydrogenase
MTPAAPDALKLAEIRTELVAALGASSVMDDLALLDTHSGDWSEAPRQAPCLLVQPRTPGEVALALQICTRYRQPVVVQGGLTGLAGGATPLAGELALSLARLNQIEDIDTLGGTALVQAGAILEEVQRQVEEHGWSFPLDLGARGSCQVGGNAATNAGGNCVIRYGTMRDLVLGVEVALADGRVLTMLNRVVKNTTGADLKHLFIGSEGVLGVITRLVLKLVPRPAAATTALCALPSFGAAAALLRNLRRELPSLSAFELMWSDFMEAATQMGALRQPFAAPHPIYALVETQGGGEAQDRERLEEILGSMLDSEVVADVVVAQSLEDARRLWAYREAIGEMLSRMKPHAAFDVGIPMAAMDAFVETVRDALEQRFAAQRHLFFGHLGDGNLHLLSGPYAVPEQLHAVEEIVYAAVGRMNGSVSAEHGIGVVKKEFLHWSRSADEMAVMRQLKALFDPAGILNAGRVLDRDSV